MATEKRKYEFGGRAGYGAVDFDDGSQTAVSGVKPTKFAKELVYKFQKAYDDGMTFAGDRFVEALAECNEKSGKEMAKCAAKKVSSYYPSFDVRKKFNLD